MKKRVKLVFPQNLIKEPILFTVVKVYNIIPNIRRARVTETVAEIVVDITGEEENIDLAIQALIKQGVDAEIIEAAD
jgi:ABC-type methionine transport system ATPase subunit